MKILLIAYEYPPIVSAQSLRWFYLANEMAVAGVKVDILTTRIRDRWGFSGRIHPDIRLHRCFPGPFIHCPEWFLKSRVAVETAANCQPPQDRPDNPSGPLSRGYGMLRDFLDKIVFPDVRSEWFPFAWKMLNRLLRSESYDVLVSSHEPGVDVLLGLAARKKFGIPWVVDLGDPLLAPYTPWWRVRLDLYVEGVVVQRADHMIVTTPAVMRLLQDRHHVSAARFTVVPQGFDKNRQWFLPGKKIEDGSVQFSPSNRTLKIVFTGTFYRHFRKPGEFFKALQQTENIHLIIAGNVTSFLSEIKSLGNKVTVLDKQNHEFCLNLQRSATLLLNIGNTQAYQIPGKLFEYFGACRPILHLSGSEMDPASEILARTRRGVVAANNSQDIFSMLQHLYRFWEMGMLDGQFDLSVESVENYSWESASRQVRGVMERICVRSS